MAKSYQKSGKTKEAIDEFEKTTSYSPETALGMEAARLGGELAYYTAEDFKRAIFFYRHIVRHSQNPQEIKVSQKKIAEIYYEKFSDYAQAIVEYNRLLSMNPPRADEIEYKVKIAKAYYYSANFDQTLMEVAEFEKKLADSEKYFEMLALRANAYMGQKHFDDAIKTYEIIQRQFPNHEQIAEIYLNKSIAYEEKKDWDNAVKTLQAIKDKYPHPEVLDLRIKSIIRRKEKKKAA